MENMSIYQTCKDKANQFAQLTYLQSQPKPAPERTITRLEQSIAGDMLTQREIAELLAQ